MFFKKSLGLLVALSFFVIILASVHFKEAFEYNTDEGLYLMRSFLLLKGHVLYKQVWLDQPPVLVLLLSWLLKFLGPSVYICRILILVFSALLIWAVYQIISKMQDLFSAVLAVLLIIFSSSYVLWSVSVMAVIPPVSFAVLAIYAMLLYRAGHKVRYLLLSGGLFALALLTKFLTVIFLPALLFEIFRNQKEKSVKENSTASLACAYAFWSAGFLAVFLCISFVVTSVDFYQLWHPYILAKSLHSLTHENVLSWLKKEYDVLILAICALVFLKWRERRLIFFPLISFIFGVFILSNHAPLWPHHRFYLLLPLCWLASVSIYILRNQVSILLLNKSGRKRTRPFITTAFLCAALGLSFARMPLKYTRIKKQLTRTITPGEAKVVDLMNKYAPEVRLVVTDRPIFAFYANLPVHPHFTLASLKIMSVGIITADDYLNIIRNEQPELVLFARFRMLRKKIAPYLQKDYFLEYQSRDGTSLYVLKRIKKDYSRHKP